MAIESLTFPCLFLTGEEWEALPEKLEDPFFQRLHETNLRTLERLEAGPDRRVGSRTLKGRIVRGTVAWYLTRDERYLQIALDALETACRAHDLWWVTDESTQMIRAANLSTGEMLFNVAFAYDALHPYLTDEQKRMCLDALTGEGLAAYLKGLELEDWWVKCDFNWNSALHANAGLAALAIRNHDRALSDRALAECLAGLPYMIDAFYEDGGWIEGVMYFGTAIGHLTDFVQAYERLGGDDMGLLSNRAVEDTITWRMYMWGGDGRCYNFSDVSEFFGGRGLSQFYWWAHKLQRPDWIWENDHGMRDSHGAGLFHDVESFWYREKFAESREPELKPLRHFKGIDWLTYRGDRLWLAFRSGFNGGNHDNDDLGHFILGFGEERFLCDPGYGPKNASQHNCIVVRRFEQADCATARIERLEELPGGFYLRCNIQEAFPFSTIHYDRHLLLIDNEHLLLVDDICGSKRVRVTVRTHFQTRLPVERTDEGFAIQGTSDRLRLIHLTPAMFFEQDDWENERHRHSDGVIHRFSWKRDRDSIHMLKATLLTFGDPEISHDISHDGIRLTVDGRTWKLKAVDGRFDFDG